MSNRKHIKLIVLENRNQGNTYLMEILSEICHDVFFPGFTFDIQHFGSFKSSLDSIDYDLAIIIYDYSFSALSEHGTISEKDFLGKVKKQAPECKVLVVSSHIKIRLVKELINNGVYELIEKNSETKNNIVTAVRNIINNL